MSALIPAFVLLNPTAGGGRAEEAYARLRPALGARFAPIESSTHEPWRDVLARAISHGARVCIAAGGDGTVHALVNALLELGGGRMPAGIVLGAIGLGSSNDFHKPARAHMQGIPVRLELDGASAHDLVSVSYRAGGGPMQRSTVVVSASLGIAAAGNALFNRGDPVLRALKPRSPGVAIAYTAVRSLLEFRAVHGRIALPDRQLDAEVFNLSMTKRAHVTGGLRYEHVTAVDSGLVDVFLAEDRGSLRRAAMLLRASRGRFLGAPGAHHWAVPRLSVRLERRVELELDGEIVLADEADLEVIERGALVCG